MEILLLSTFNLGIAIFVLETQTEEVNIGLRQGISSFF